MDVVAIRQQLLSQYDTLQSRIKELKEAAENEVVSIVLDFSSKLFYGYMLHYMLHYHQFLLHIQKIMAAQSCERLLYRFGCWLACVNWKTKFLPWENLLIGESSKITCRVVLISKLYPC